ncbi:MAG: M1 family metallopeptidase [bacterium]
MKKNYSLCMILLLFSLHSVQSQTIFEQPLSPRNANYDIKVTLDTEEKQIKGTEILRWRNISNDAVRELQFHLYMNAFKNNKSTFIKESGGSAPRLRKNKGWGWIDINSLEINNQDFSDKIEFIQPDDNNKFDQTVIKVDLNNPVWPGREIEVSIHFTTQLPLIYRRNGYYENYFFAAQWFPKIGVYIDNQWNCHQFHAHSEFFADYGVYNVDITLPKQYIVGATGILQSQKVQEDKKTISFHAEDVHDFAWTAWPEYLIEKEMYRNIEIAVYHEKDHQGQIKRTLTAVKNAIDFMTNWVGEYPYPKITVVHPPTKCMYAAGMEYPMFITGGAFWGVPEGIKLTEMVTIHEFTHNYWYGMVGSNEFEEAWLDEGINTFTEIKIMNTYYGEETSLFDFAGIKIGEIPNNRMSYIRISDRDRTLQNAWDYIGGGYSTFSYTKPALMLLTLENLVGQDTMDTIMRTYFQRWKFKHPHTSDFIAVVNEVTGKDYNWFFQQLLEGSNELDYRVASIYSKKEKARKGIFDFKGEKKLLPEKDTKKDTLENYHTIVKINRKGEVTMPVEILFVFSDGDSLMKKWDGKQRWVKYEFYKLSKLKFAAVDPHHKILLDSNFANNSKTMKPNNKLEIGISVKMLYWFQSILEFFTIFS